MRAMGQALRTVTQGGAQQPPDLLGLDSCRERVQFPPCPY